MAGDRGDLVNTSRPWPSTPLPTASSWPSPAALLGALLAPWLAALGGLATWDGSLVLSAAWLVGGVAPASILWGSTRPGTVSAASATLAQAVVFAEPRWSLAIQDSEHALAVLATTALAAIVVLAAHVARSYRRPTLAPVDTRDVILEHLSRLQEVTARLAAARTTEDVVAVVVEDVRQLTGATAASLWVVDGEHLLIRGSSGYEEGVVDNYRRVAVDADVPVAEANRQRRVVIAAGRDDISARWPGVAAVVRHEGLAALPLVIEDVCIGSIGLSFDTPPPTRQSDISFLVALAVICSNALLRARLYDAERAARQAAEAATARLAFLAAASDRLNASLEWETTLEEIVAMAVPTLADWCAVFVWNDRDEMVPLAWAGAGWGDRDEILEGARRASLLDKASRHESPDGVSTAYSPMGAAGRRVGAIALGTTAGPMLHDQDLATAAELARRGAQAAVNAFLFNERERVATSLQRSLLPPATPTVPGLEVATRFHALGEGLDVGGDFYDVVRLGHPAAPDNRWAVIIGDVRGKGTEAAAVTGAARHAIRAFALDQSSPAQMLGSLNDLLLVTAEEEQAHYEPRFCTAVVAVVEPAPDGARVVLGVAGHPAPLVLRRHGGVEVVRATGSLLGVLADPRIEEQEVLLGRGDALVLYTDGITERHDEGRFFDEEDLVRVLSRCAGFTADVLAERIEMAARAFVEVAPRDDLAIVVVRVPEGTAVGTSVAAELPADTTAPGRARRFVTLALDGYGLTDQVEPAVLLTSEVVTNAVVHGGGNARISVERRAGCVRISVSDANPERPRRLDLGIDATSGRGVQLLAELADRWGVDPLADGKLVWFELDG